MLLDESIAKWTGFQIVKLERGIKHGKSFIEVTVEAKGETAVLYPKIGQLEKYGVFARMVREGLQMLGVARKKFPDDIWEEEISRIIEETPKVNRDMSLVVALENYVQRQLHAHLGSGDDGISDFNRVHEYEGHLHVDLQDWYRVKRMSTGEIQAVEQLLDWEKIHIPMGCEGTRHVVCRRIPNYLVQKVSKDGELICLDAAGVPGKVMD